MTISSSQELCEFLSKSSTNVNSNFTDAINYINNATDLDYIDENGRTALSYASELGSEQIVELLIDKGADVNLLPNPDSYTPLMIAALNQDTKVARILLDRGADRYIENSEGKTAIDIAIKSSNSKIRELFDMNVKIDQKISQSSFLEKYPEVLTNKGVCSGFNLEITRWAMKHIENGKPEEQIDVIGKINSAFEKNSDNFAKRLMLYQSEQYNSVTTAIPITYKNDNFFDSLPEEMKNKKFIGFGFNVIDNNKKVNGAHTINIRRIGDSESYEVIDVNYGSKKCENKKELNHHIETILYSYNNTSTVPQDMRGIAVYDIEEIVRKRDLLPEPLLQDASEEEREAQKKRNKEKKYEMEGSILLAINAEAPTAFVNSLIEKGVDVNVKDNNGKTGLMYAASSGNLPVTELLIEKGADVNVKDNNGKTGLMYAASSGNLPIAELLIEKGAKLDIQQNDGNTALISAIKQRNIDMATLLIKKGADINTQNIGGESPLFLAIESGNAEILDLLIKKGADLSMKNNDGYDPLTVSVGQNKLDIAERLINAGVDVNIKDSDNNTPLMFAVGVNNYELTDILIKKGADINTQNIGGESPLFLAIESGNAEILDLLIKNGADISIHDKNGKTALDLAHDYKNDNMISMLQFAEIKKYIVTPIKEAGENMGGNITDVRNLPPAPSKKNNGKEIG